MTEPVYVTYYTDPLCSWSWAFETPWRRLLWELGGQVRYRYRMAGLLPDWRRYQDPLNSVSRPGQMAPQWILVHEMTGVPLNPNLWHTNPPGSSYPACAAFKAAERRGPAFAEAYLRRLREAAILEARDISDPVVLAATVEQANADLDVDARVDAGAVTSDLGGAEAQAALRKDIKEARYLEVGRFPTVIFHRAGGRGLALTGYRPYPALREGLARFAPELLPELLPPAGGRDAGGSPPPLGVENLPGYVAHWRRVTRRELADNFGLPPDVADAELERLGVPMTALADVHPAPLPACP